MSECHGRRFSFEVKVLFWAVVVTAISTFTGCGPQRELESRGVLAVVQGKIQHLESESDQAQICSDNFCEPNYLYTVNFGRTRPEPPAQPTPSPVRTPGASPAQPYEEAGYSHEFIRVPDAWNLSVGREDIVVAVVDTGIDYTHIDLRNNIWRNLKELNGRAGVDDDGNGYVDDIYGWDFSRNQANGDDDNKHGTHCAGIIGAEKNGIGVRGINQRVKIMPLKFLNAQGGGDTLAAIKAIDYAVANGARVISNSWGGGGYSSLLNDAIQRAIAKGVYVVAAAGNESNDNDSRPTYPANYSGVISVASSDQADELSYFSNFGSQTVFIAAPGSSIYSTVPGGYYEKLSGTSMATPQVSGAIALALSVRPELSVGQMKEALCGSAKKILTRSASCGRLDVGELVRRVSLLN